MEWYCICVLWYGIVLYWCLMILCCIGVLWHGIVFVFDGMVLWCIGV